MGITFDPFTAELLALEYSPEIMPRIYAWYSEGRIGKEWLERRLGLFYQHSAPSHDLTIDQLVALFRAAVWQCSDEEEPPSEVLTVYRGASVDKIHGISWTLDLERAQSFARRHGDWDPTTRVHRRESTVYIAEAPPECVLGMFTGIDDEDEVIVDPSGLRNVRALIDDLGPEPPVPFSGDGKACRRP
jgi:hypothetical protein